AEPAEPAPVDTPPHDATTDGDATADGDANGGPDANGDGGDNVTSE
ncbi:MAG: hypothetical protein JWP39_3722, partial [Jatrophihabitans sp.]|nr:hypothetical protein [Jatrophihabitans sp.]